ncbi:hypothetical protein B0D95_13360 [Cellvibrio sp. PSBB023]|nr:hypothetical protein B0D95_13360 [Cellvibrio sp. PSBB023]
MMDALPTARRERIVEFDYLRGISIALIALFMHRPESNTNFLQCLIYFTPFYLLGILFSQYRIQLQQWHWPLLIISLCVFIVVFLVQLYGSAIIASVLRKHLTSTNRLLID